MRGACVSKIKCRFTMVPERPDLSIGVIVTVYRPSALPSVGSTVGVHVNSFVPLGVMIPDTTRPSALVTTIVEPSSPNANPTPVGSNSVTTTLMLALLA